MCNFWHMRVNFSWSADAIDAILQWDWEGLTYQLSKTYLSDCNYQKTNPNATRIVFLATAGSRRLLQVQHERSLKYGCESFVQFWVATEGTYFLSFVETSYSATKRGDNADNNCLLASDLGRSRVLSCAKDSVKVWSIEKDCRLGLCEEDSSKNHHDSGKEYTETLNSKKIKR